MFRLVDKIRKPRQQGGLYIVEFAIVGAVFLIVLFMIIEFGRLLYTWSVLDEITRRGARLAAVCPIYGEPESAGMFTRATLPRNPLNIATNQLVIEYLGPNGGVIASPDATDGAINFVRARIVNYTYEAIFPINIDFNAPAFETTQPAESLGVSPPGTGDTQC